jgi:hypothetical protein
MINSSLRESRNWNGWLLLILIRITPKILGVEFNSADYAEQFHISQVEKPFKTKPRVICLEQIFWQPPIDERYVSLCTVHIC